MPWVRKGKTVYKETPNGLVKKGSSKTIEGAKAYLRALYANSKDEKSKDWDKYRKKK